MRNGSFRPGTKTFFIRLLLLTGAGFLLRLWMCAEIIPADSFAYAPPFITDMAVYQTLSDDIFHGNFPSTFYFQPFYYAVFLPFFKLLLPLSSAWAAAFGQCLCSAGIIWFCALSSARLFGRKAGLLAAAFALFSSMLAFYVPYALIEIQQAFWITLTFYLTLRGLTGKSGRSGSAYFLGAAFILGLSILSRGNSWFFMPLLLLAAAYRQTRSRSGVAKRILMAFAILCMILLPQIPFIIYNTIAQGRLTGPSTAGPAVLALGNNPEAPPGYLDYPETYQVWMENPDKVPVRILEWFVEEPLAYLELTFRKFLLFWNHLEIPNNIAWGYNGTQSFLLHRVFILPTGLFLVLALGAFFMLARRCIAHKGILLLELFILAYALATTAFYMLARFRVPIIPLLIVLSAAVPFSLLSDWKKRDFRRLFFMDGCGLLFAVFTVFFADDVYRTYYEPEVMRFARPNGVSLKSNDLKKLTVFDHGPKMLGGWKSLPLKEGMTFVKSFAPKKPEPSAGKTVRLKILFDWKQENSFFLIVNGKKQWVHYVPEKEADLKETEVIMPYDGNPVFTFEIKGLGNSSTSIVVDAQRKYGRSLLDGLPFPAEFVIRAEFIDSTSE